MTTNLNVGLVHDWLPVIGGGEKVLKEMVACFPNSHIYTIFDFLTIAEREELLLRQPLHVSYLNSLPGVKKYYRYLILLATRAIEAFDVTDHEVVLSSSAAFSKGVLTSPGQKHFAYVHSPARYAWDLTHDYINGIDGVLGVLKRAVAREMMHKFRVWDMRTTAGVDHFIANSEFIKKRIWKTYRREAEVIYPPVDIQSFSNREFEREDFYFTASRFVPYKKIPMIVEAFNRRPDLRLVIAGDGPEMNTVAKLAGPNISLKGHVKFSKLENCMQRCRAFVFAAREDFGIVPVEAQACGAPVIALGQAGTLETVRNLDRQRPTGVLFDTQTPESMLAAIDKFEANLAAIKPQYCRENAELFSTKIFHAKLTKFIYQNLN